MERLTRKEIKQLSNAKLIYTDESGIEYYLLGEIITSTRIPWEDLPKSVKKKLEKLKKEKCKTCEKITRIWEGFLKFWFTIFHKEKSING